MARVACAPRQHKVLGGITTITDLTEYFRVSTSTLYQVEQSGTVFGLTARTHWRPHESAAERWFKRNSATEMGS